MRNTTALLGLIGAIATGCGDDGGGGGGSSGSTGDTTATTTATTTITTSDTTTMSTSASTTATETSSSSDATTATTESTGSEETTAGTGSATTETGADSSSSDSGGQGQCAQNNESCLVQDCCGNLDCCEGVPIPMGEAICAPQCPDSDRNIKEGFAAVDVDRVLDHVIAMPITTWSYRDDPSGARHIGPMAQDFKAAFAVGGSDKAIAKVDADGVALASVQALHRQVTNLEAENAALRESVRALEARLDAIAP